MWGGTQDRLFSIVAFSAQRLNNTDVFYAETDFNVTTGTQTATPITLSRIVGKIEILPTDLDKMPSNITGISIGALGARENEFRLSPDPVEPGKGWGWGWDGSGLGSLPLNYISVMPFIPRADLLKVTKDNPISFVVFPVKVVNPTKSDKVVGTLAVRFATSVVSETQISSLPGFNIKYDYEVKANQVLRLTGKLFTKDVATEGIQVNNEWGATIENSFD